MNFAEELKRMSEDHIVSGSIGPLFDAGWAAACQFWAKKLGEMLLDGPLVPFERAVIDAAMARLERWHKDEPGGLLPADHPRGLTGTARDLVVACLALEKARLGATSGGQK